MTQNYYSIVKHYESCLAQYGDTHKGVDWPNLEDVDKRYSIMLDVIKFKKDLNLPIRLLDFGCGTAHMYDYIKKNQLDFIHYSGLDISDKFIEVAKSKYNEVDFFCLDILKEEMTELSFDFVLMNGVFTEKRDLSFDEMWRYFTRMIEKVFPLASEGVAFNVMSKAVDWERDDLFHLPADLLIDFLTKKITRNFILRNDYGLYEYTVYIYK